MYTTTGNMYLNNTRTITTSTASTTFYDPFGNPSFIQRPYIKPKKQFWFKKIIETCEVCGSTEERRERVEGSKPSNPEDRVVHLKGYDYCAWRR
jgi:hypothetical protein